MIHYKPNLLIIKTLAKGKKLTIKDLSRKIGMSEQGLHKSIKNNNISVEYLAKIANELQVNINVLFDLN